MLVWVFLRIWILKSGWLWLTKVALIVLLGFEANHFDWIETNDLFFILAVHCATASSTVSLSKVHEIMFLKLSYIELVLIELVMSWRLIKWWHLKNFWLLNVCISISFATRAVLEVLFSSQLMTTETLEATLIILNVDLVFTTDHLKRHL